MIYLSFATKYFYLPTRELKKGSKKCSRNPSYTKKSCKKNRQECIEHGRNSNNSYMDKVASATEVPLPIDGTDTTCNLLCSSHQQIHGQKQLI
jgi:hypothetical protein